MPEDQDKHQRAQDLEEWFSGTEDEALGGLLGQVRVASADQPRVFAAPPPPPPPAPPTATGDAQPTASG